MYHYIIEGVGWTIGFLCASSIVIVAIYTIVYLIMRKNRGGRA